MWDQHFQPENHLDVGVQGQQSIRDRKWRSECNPVFNDSFNGAKRIKEVRTFYSARFKVIPNRFLRDRQKAHSQTKILFPRVTLIGKSLEFREQTTIWTWEFKKWRHRSIFSVNLWRWLVECAIFVKSGIQLKLCCTTTLSRKRSKSRSHSFLNIAFRVA
jgi:hypothetical protein